MPAITCHTKNYVHPAHAAAFVRGTSSRRLPGLGISPRANRCARCGQFVGERYAAFEHDRMADRRRLTCARCVEAIEGGAMP
jgi:recombinational DNA repair protein (RecF pathway)